MGYTLSCQGLEVVNLVWFPAKLATGRGLAQPENADISFRKSQSVTFRKKCHFAKTNNFSIFREKVKKLHVLTFRSSLQKVVFRLCGHSS